MGTSSVGDEEATTTKQNHQKGKRPRIHPKRNEKEIKKPLFKITRLTGKRREAQRLREGRGYLEAKEANKRGVSRKKRWRDGADQPVAEEANSYRAQRA